MNAPMITNKIPPEVSQPISSRLRTLRQLRGLFTHDYEPYLSAGTVTNIELHDCSGVRLKDLWHIAPILGMTFTELVHAIIPDGAEEVVDTEEGRRKQRLNVAFNRLDPDNQARALGLLHTLYELQAGVSDFDNSDDSTNNNGKRSGKSVRDKLRVATDRSVSRDGS